MHECQVMCKISTYQPLKLHKLKVETKLYNKSIFFTFRDQNNIVTDIVVLLKGYASVSSTYEFP